MKSDLTKKLLLCGAIAGPIYMLVGLAQIFTREGFDATKHPLSMLSLGDMGWIQIANFLLTGILVVLGAIGLRRALKGDKRWKRGALFVLIYGLGILGGGLFITDPSLGFPPGTPDTYPETFSWHALLHFIFSQIGFLAIMISSFVFARYFAVNKVKSWKLYSLFTGLFFIVGLFASMAGMGTAWGSIALYLAVGNTWVWLTLLSLRTRKNLQ